MSSNFVTLNDIDVQGKRVLVRLDLNVPMQDGKVMNDERIVRSLPTIQELSKKQAKVIIITHLGRPEGNGYEEEFSLKPIVKVLAEKLGKDVAFAEDCIGEKAITAVKKLENGGILVLENVRFHKEETKNDKDFTAKLAELGDIFVSDAFSAAHRAHSSTVGLATQLPYAAGRLMEAELTALEQALENPVKPVVAVVGGAKVSTKLNVLYNLLQKVDYIIIGGGMANTFLYALGVDVGHSLCEKDMKASCLEIIEKVKKSNCQLVLPKDFQSAQKLAVGVEVKQGDHGSLEEGYEILDAGKKSIDYFISVLEKAKTVVWNGPLGAFEIAPFDAATNAVAKAVASLTKQGKLVSIAGGGDTISALAKAGVYNDFTYVSTAGGAFLEWMEGKKLPGVVCLLKK
ncbi:Phosphoglycerate kinase [Candidatus Hepatincola sp. Pdp]